jgi:hypothetical protein
MIPQQQERRDLLDGGPHPATINEDARRLPRQAYRFLDIAVMVCEDRHNRTARGGAYNADTPVPPMVMAVTDLCGLAAECRAGNKT